MRHISVVFLLSIFCISAFSQSINVKSFHLLENDLDARVHFPKRDQNGVICAILKVVTTQTGFSFDVGSLGVMATEQKKGEIWVYVPHGVQRITISHSHLGILRNYPFSIPIQSAMVYEMILTTGKVITSIEENIPDPQYVVITSTPSGADVYINNEHKGTTHNFQPLMTEGEYTYRVEKKFYYPEAGKFAVTANEGVNLSIILKPNFGFAAITTKPEDGMNVTIDGKPLAKTTPVTTDTLKAGKYKIAVSKALYHEQTKEITIVDNQTLPVNFTVIPAFGWISVDSNPEQGAIVLLDDKETGMVTPCKLDRVVSGKHKITLRKDWYEPKSFYVEVFDGKESKFPSAALVPTFGIVKITSDPQSEIFIDNQSKGIGSWEGRLIAGLHLFEAKNSKHHPASQTIDLKIGTVQELSLMPKPMYGKLNVIANTIGATIKLNGQDYGTTPKIIDKLFVGDYTMTLAKLGFGTLTKNITITENATTVANETLSTGMMVTITSDPSGAELSIDGTPYGKTPQEITLGFGKHTVKLVNGKRIVEESINVNENGSKQFAFNVNEERSVYITSNANNASVYVNDKYLGATPLQTKLLLGENKFMLEKDNEFYETNETIVLTPTSSDQIFIKMKYNPRSPIYISNFTEKIYGDFQSFGGYLFEGLTIKGVYSIVSIKGEPALITAPLLFKFHQLKPFTTKLNTVFVTTAIFSEIIASKSSFSWDMLSIGLGYVVASKSHRTKLKMEFYGAMGGQFASQKSVYQGNEIIRAYNLNISKDNEKGGFDNWAYISSNFRINIEQYIGGKSFLVFLFGMTKRAEMKWYYKTDLDSFEDSGGITPQPLFGDDLPKSPYFEGFTPYYGVGVRF
jgi:hypothetical protein